MSTILNYYDSSFGLDDFMRIVAWMPYIVELVFAGDRLVEKKELAAFRDRGYPERSGVGEKHG